MHRKSSLAVRLRWCTARCQISGCRIEVPWLSRFFLFQWNNCPWSPCYLAGNASAFSFQALELQPGNTVLLNNRAMAYLKQVTACSGPSFRGDFRMIKWNEIEENRHVVSVFVSCKMLIQCWLIQLGNHGKSYRLSFAQCQIYLSWTPRSSLEAMFQEALVDANHSLSLDQSKENIKAGQRGCQNTVRIQKYPEPLHSWYKPFQTFLWLFFPKASPMLGFSFSLLRRGGSKTEASTSWTDSRPWEMAWGKRRWEGARWKRGRTGNIRKPWEIGWGGLTDRKPWEIAWGELVGRVRDGSVDGQETLGERASLGGGRRKRSEAWTDGQLGESSVGRGRNGSMDGQETVGNSLGKNSIGRERCCECRAVGKGFTGQIRPMRLSRKIVCPRLVKWFPNRWVVEHASEKLRDWRDVVISHGVLFAFCPVISPAKQLNLTRTQASEMRGMVWHGVANLFIGFKRVGVMETECCIKISRRVENILIKGPDSATC